MRWIFNKTKIPLSKGGRIPLKTGSGGCKILIRLISIVSIIFQTTPASENVGVTPLIKGELI
jgi:hypothetical protein